MVIFHSYVKLPEGKAAKVEISGENEPSRSLRKCVKHAIATADDSTASHAHDVQHITEVQSNGTNSQLHLQHAAESNRVVQWIGLRENLQETMVFTIKYRGFL